MNAIGIVWISAKLFMVSRKRCPFIIWVTAFEKRKVIVECGQKIQMRILSVVPLRSINLWKCSKNNYLGKGILRNVKSNSYKTALFCFLTWDAYFSKHLPVHFLRIIDVDSWVIGNTGPLQKELQGTSTTATHFDLHYQWDLPYTAVWWRND